MFGPLYFFPRAENKHETEMPHNFRHLLAPPKECPTARPLDIPGSCSIIWEGARHVAVHKLRS